MGRQIEKIADMILPLDCVDSSGRLDLEKWTGRKDNNIPVEYRDRDEPFTQVSSLIARLGDPTCNPSSGGVAGNEHLCRFYGVGSQQFARNIATYRAFLRRMGSIWVSNVSSVWADGRAYREAVDAKRSANLIQYK